MEYYYYCKLAVQSYLDICAMYVHCSCCWHLWMAVWYLSGMQMQEPSRGKKEKKRKEIVVNAPPTMVEWLAPLTVQTMNETRR